MQFVYLFSSLPVLGTAMLLEQNQQGHNLAIRGVNQVLPINGWENNTFSEILAGLTSTSSVSAGFGVPLNTNPATSSSWSTITIPSTSTTTSYIDIEVPSIVPAAVSATSTVTSSETATNSATSSESTVFITISPIFATTDIPLGPSITKVTETTITTVTNDVTVTITTPVIVTVAVTPTSTVIEHATTAATTSKPAGVIGMPVHQHTHTHEDGETHTHNHEHESETVTYTHVHDHDFETATHTHTHDEACEVMSTTTIWTTVTTTIPTVTPSVDMEGASSSTTITSTDITPTTATYDESSATFLPAQTVATPTFLTLSSIHIDTGTGVPFMAGTGGVKVLFVAIPTGMFSNGTETAYANATSSTLSAELYTPTIDTYGKFMPSHTWSE